MVIPLLRQMTAILWPFRFLLSMQNYSLCFVSKIHFSQNWYHVFEEVRWLLSLEMPMLYQQWEPSITQSKEAYLCSQINYIRNNIGRWARSGRTIKLRSFVATEELPSDIHCLISVSEKCRPKILDSPVAHPKIMGCHFGRGKLGDEIVKFALFPVIMKAGNNKIGTWCSRSLLVR